MYKSLLSAFFVTVGVIFLLPWIDGIYFEKVYKQFQKTYNLQGNIMLQMISYKRGWFSTDAVVSLVFIHPESIPLLSAFDIPSNAMPRYYVFNQHIQHGPIFFKHNTTLPSLVGLAEIENKILSTSDLENFLQFLGADDSFSPIINSFADFDGSYYTYIKCGKIDSFYLSNYKRIRFDSLEGNFWVWPFPKVPHVNGEVYFHNFFIADDNSSMLRSTVQLNFSEMLVGGSWNFSITY